MLRALTILTASIIVSTGFIVGALIVGDKLARENTVAVVGTPADHMTSGGMMGNAAQASAPAKSVSIVHVQRGCHDWSDGDRRGPTFNMQLAPGEELTITDQDVDPHRLIQLAGPKVKVGQAMMTGDSTKIVFPMKGVYRFATQTLEMPGMAEVETIGPDHNLKLTVDVA